MPDTLLASCNDLDIQLDEGLLTLRLSAPNRGNTLTQAMLTALDTVLQQIALRDDVRVVILRGAGADFSRGLDIQDFANAVQTDVPRARTSLERLNQWRSRSLRLLPQPVIGVVHGACHGAAMRLIEGCDIVLATHDAEFMFTADDSAVLAHHPVCVAGPDWMEAAVLTQLQVPGHTFTGREAELNGWITTACAPESLEHDVLDLARSLVDKDRLALQFTKETVAHVGSMSWDAAVNFTAAKFAELKARQAGSASARASGVQSFLAGKSKPGLGT